LRPDEPASFVDYQSENKAFGCESEDEQDLVNENFSGGGNAAGEELR
jgi:hypothetical protein